MEEKNFAIIVAGGKGERLGGKIPKQFQYLRGKTVIEHTIDHFEKCELIDEIVVVINPIFIETMYDIRKNNRWKKVTKIVSGGETRQESVKNGLVSISENSGKVLIHDGVRPLISADLIRKLIEKLSSEKAVIPIIFPRDSMVKIDNSTVEEFVKRDSFAQIQTPQGFNLKVIKKAHDLAWKEGRRDFTDDSSMITHYNLGRISVVEGDYYNIKITYPGDLELINCIMEDIE